MQEGDEQEKGQRNQRVMDSSHRAAAKPAPGRRRKEGQRQGDPPGQDRQREHDAHERGHSLEEALEIGEQEDRHESGQEGQIQRRCQRQRASAGMGLAGLDAPESTEQSARRRGQDAAEKEDHEDERRPEGEVLAREERDTLEGAGPDEQMGRISR